MVDKLLLFGGVALVSGFISFLFFKKKIFSKGIEYDVGPSIVDPDPFIISKLEEQMPTRPITDDYVQDYNRFINGYRDKPTMVPENYYSLPFRYDGPEKGILTSPGVPDRFGSNQINPDPNAADRWIRQNFSF